MMFNQTKPLFGRSAFRSIGLLALFALLASYFASVPLIRPAQAQDTNDITEVTLSDARPSQTVNIQAVFSTPNSLGTALTACPADPCARVALTFPSDLNDNGYFTVATGTTGDVSLSGWTAVNASTSQVTAIDKADRITWTFDTAGPADPVFDKTTTYTLTWTGLNLTNPATVDTAMPITVSLFTKTTNGWTPVVAQGAANVIIKDEVTLSATVNEGLTFTVTAVPDSTLVGSIFTTTASTATTCAFGTIVPNQQYICSQQLDIETNAPNGYYIYLAQDGNMDNGSGDDIEVFKSGSRVDDQLAESWVGATGANADSDGHLGYNSTDSSVFFDNTVWAGMPTVPGAANGPNTDGLVADSTTATGGSADTYYSSFSLEVTPLQAAGTYTNEVTYIVTTRY